MSSKNKKLVLLDVHAILHRAYHALPDFATSKGEPTGALYGLVTMILKIVDDLKPDYILACFDLPQPTYRHEVYEDYKAGRAKTDGDLVDQIKRSREVFTALNIPMYEKAGFEADDMLGTIVEKLKNNKDVDVVIASGDMDTLQLVSGTKVQVYTLKKGIKDTILYDEKAVEERFGFSPKLLPDYKGLRGDPSDNIIGIAGIGEKTASEIIQKFGSIENIYNTLKKHKEKFKEAGIKERMIGLLEAGEEEAKFSKMLATIRKDAPIDFEMPNVLWKEGLDFSKAEELFKVLEFRTLSARLHKSVEGKDFVAEKLEEEEEKEIIDPQILKEAQVMLWILDSNLTNPKREDVLFRTKTNKISTAHEILEKEIEKEGFKNIYEGMEKPLISVISRMEDVGVLLDVKYLKDLGDKYHKVLASLEKEIWELSGEEFNISSPKQLGEILFEKLGLVVKNQKKTGTGAKSTKESELEKMKDLHPIIPKIMDYRELAKLLGTYIDVLPTLVKDDGRLHTTFIQTGAVTGRMATQNPGLQNIPMRTELGRAIRKAFIAEKGFQIVSLDYSQIELRIAAFLSGDEKLLDIFRSGKDVHTAVAAQVFKVEEKDVTKEMRGKAKTINFGILFGMGVTALQQNLKCSRAEAQQFYNDYFETFTGLASYLENVKVEAARDGYTTTYFGRRRYFEGIKSKIPFIRAMAERMAINAPIQGTEADIIKIAMVNIDSWIRENKFEKDVRMLLQVHDELVFEIKKEKVKTMAGEIKKLMEGVEIKEDKDKIVCRAEAEAGENWLETEEI